MNFFEDTFKRWVCPSDRELTLRAKLRSGWSSRASANVATGINESEQAAIAQVLERANRVEELENERIRKLNERLRKIKSQASGNGKKSCILCSDQPRFFSKFYSCKDCQNAVCSKCCIDTFELNSGEAIWLCKICSESREFLRKTNLWTQLCGQQEQPIQNSYNSNLCLP